MPVHKRQEITFYEYHIVAGMRNESIDKVCLDDIECYGSVDFERGGTHDPPWRHYREFNDGEFQKYLDKKSCHEEPIDVLIPYDRSDDI